MKTRNNAEASSTLKGWSSRPELTRIVLVVLVFGLLLWARFLLVTGHPRTAMADPALPGQQSPAGAPTTHAHAGDPQP